MKYRQTVTISKRDLRKLMKAKSIANIRQLAMVSGADYTVLNKCFNNKLTMSEGTWNKIKICL